MLSITVPGVDKWDESSGEFVTTRDCRLQLEHSLVSVSKWESQTRKPFLSKDQKTPEEMLDYIRCMTVTQNADPNVYNNLTYENIEEIYKYIDAPMTATWFSDEEKHKNGKKIVTSELIYYWMIKFEIPFECQKWHLNRLITLIRVCEAEERPNENVSKKELMRSRSALNAARRKKLGTRG